MTKEYYEAYEDRYKDAYDNKILYHSGASFKDLGKKCFAITKIVEDNILKELLNKLKRCNKYK